MVVGVGGFLQHVWVGESCGGGGGGDRGFLARLPLLRFPWGWGLMIVVALANCRFKALWLLEPRLVCPHSSGDTNHAALDWERGQLISSVDGLAVDLIGRGSLGFQLLMFGGSVYIEVRIYLKMLFKTGMGMLKQGMPVGVPLVLLGEVGSLWV